MEKSGRHIFQMSLEKSKFFLPFILDLFCEVKDGSDDYIDNLNDDDDDDGSETVADHEADHFPVALPETGKLRFPGASIRLRVNL